MYGGAPLSLGAFRRRLPHADRPYRLPAAGILSPLAFIIANLIILWTGWDTDWKLGVSILIGYAILVANRVFRPQRAQADAGLEGRLVADPVPDRHGRDRLPQRLRSEG